MDQLVKEVRTLIYKGGFNSRLQDCKKRVELIIGYVTNGIFT